VSIAQVGAVIRPSAEIASGECPSATQSRDHVPSLRSSRLGADCSRGWGLPPGEEARAGATRGSH
jgi:hypothetical protein